MGGVVSGIGSALGISSPKQPKAPDYTTLANQQAGLDKATANDLTVANRPTQYAPGGNIQWSQDPSTGQWTQKLSYDPSTQQGIDQSRQLASSKQNDLMNQGQFQGPDQVGAYDPHAGDAVANSYYKSVMDRAGPEQDRQRALLTTQLRQQGLTPGTQAYDASMQNIMKSQGDVNSTAAQNAVGAGYTEARNIYGAQLAGQQQNYNQDALNYARPWDTATAAGNLSAAQTKQYTPQFAGFGTATGYAPADVAGAAQQQYQAASGTASGSSGKLGGLLNTGLSAAASYYGGK